MEKCDIFILVVLRKLRKTITAPTVMALAGYFKDCALIKTVKL